MTAEELQSVIDRQLEERSTLEAAQPAAKQISKVKTMLSSAAELYREQIGLGLDGDPRAALKARALLRKLCGPILVESDPDGSVWARFDLQPAALLSQVAGTEGQGDGVLSCPCPAAAVRRISPAIFLSERESGLLEPLGYPSSRRNAYVEERPTTAAYCTRSAALVTSPNVLESSWVTVTPPLKPSRPAIPVPPRTPEPPPEYL